MIDSFNLLKKYKHKLTKQQLKTFKGQILKGDLVGLKKRFRKGVKTWNNLKKIIYLTCLKMKQ